MNKGNRQTAMAGGDFVFARWVRSALITMCDLALVYIGLALFFRVLVIGMWVFLWLGADEKSCRMGWDDVAEYPALVELCRDRTVRAALAMGDVADRAARQSESDVRANKMGAP